MMFRYIALIWNTASEQQHEATRTVDARIRQRSEWRIAFDSPGVRVYCSGVRQNTSEIYTLRKQCGVVLGTVFSRASGAFSTPDKARFGEAETAAIITSAGRQLTSSYWGRYVAFLLDHAARRVLVLKDPVGSLPCLWTTYRNVRIFFSDIGDCRALDLIHFTVNWRQVRERVAGAWLATSESCLNEVSEVYRGECLQISEDKISRQFYWNPLAISREGKIESLQDAAHAAYQEVTTSIRAWSARYTHIVHRLSGGLDSSLVLGCLRQAREPSTVTCVTYYNPLSPIDERRAARLALEGFGCRHVEHPRSPRLEVNAILEAAPSVAPRDIFSYVETGPIERKLAAEVNASAVFTGDGGDSLFGRHSREFAASDYVRRHGLTLRVFSLAAEVALLTELSAWRVLGLALRARVLRQTLDRQRELITMGRKLVEPGLLESAFQKRTFSHPWFNDEEDVPWSTILQLGTLIERPSFYDPLSGRASDPEIVSPLFSQPIAELCLRVPIDVHIRGGRDRTVVRRAFTKEVPDRIRKCHWKERAPGFFEAVFTHNLPFARELLLDGTLVRERLLDRNKLNRVLSGTPTKEGVYVSEIFDHMAVEAWLRTWETDGVQAKYSERTPDALTAKLSA